MPIAPDVVLGARVLIPQPELANLYGCALGDDTTVGRGALAGAVARVIGDRRDRP